MTVLGGVLRCPYCGARGSRSGSKRQPSYRCGAMGVGKACQGFSAPMPITDDVVATMFLSRLAGLQPGDPLLEAVADAWTARVSPEALAARAIAADELKAAEANLERVRDLVIAGTFTDEDAAAVMPRLREAVAAAQDRLRALPVPEADISALLDMAQSRAAWDELPNDERREMLALAIAKVEITRAGRRGVSFDPHTRMLITWQDGSQSRPTPSKPIKVQRNPPNSEEVRAKRREADARYRAQLKERYGVTHRPNKP